MPPLLVMLLEHPHTHGGAATHAVAAAAAGGVFGDPLRLLLSARSTTGVAVVVGCEGALTREKEEEEGRRSATMSLCWRDGEPAAGPRSVRSRSVARAEERVGM